MPTRRLVFSPLASKQLGALHPPLSERVRLALDQIASDIFAGKPLKGPLKGKFSYRIGDWRIIYLPQDDSVFIETVDHRGRVYRG